MTSSKHLFFIVNEYSGSGKGRLIEKFVHKFESEYVFTAELHKTSSQGHASELANQSAEKIQREQKNGIIVAVGGDGTLNEVVSGLGTDYPDIPIGYIPTGSGNDFARTHHLPTETESAFRHLLEVLEPKKRDILTYTDTETGEKGFAVNSLGIGIDAMVIHLLNQSKKKEKLAKSGLGKSSYITSAISAFFKQHSFAVTIKTEEGEQTFKESLLALCTNNPYFGGGLNINPTSSSEDELLEMIVAEKLSFSELLKLLYLILTGGRHLSHPKVHIMQSRSFSLQIHSPQYGQTDGEELEKHSHRLQISSFKRLFLI